MACKYPFARRTQPCAVLLQAILNGCIVTQLFSAKAGGIARASQPAAPVVFRDGHLAPMQNTSPLIKTERQKVIETCRFLHIAHHRSSAAGIAAAINSGPVHPVPGPAAAGGSPS